MRLIDANKVKQFPYSPESGTEDMVSEWIYECGLYDLELYVTDECPVDVEQALKDLCRKTIEGFMNIIDTEPTAYDVEKVVEELEEMQVKAEKDMQLSDNVIEANAYGGMMLAYGLAIPKVEKGGVE